MTCKLLRADWWDLFVSELDSAQWQSACIFVI